MGTTWKRASRHMFLRRAQGKECPPLRSSSPRPPRNCKKQDPCVATATQGAAPHPGEDAGLRVYIDVPGLNRATSQECFWPSRVASAYQRNMRQVLAAQEARFHAVLEEMETVFREPLEPPEPPEAQGPGGS